MGADVGALVVPELVVDCEQPSVAVDARLDPVGLLARVVGADQVLAPVLDPFDRAPEPQRRDADQHVLRIELAADAEAAADMRLVHAHRRRAAL
jgi:hypothetical protein